MPGTVPMRSGLVREMGMGGFSCAEIQGAAASQVSVSDNMSARVNAFFLSLWRQGIPVTNDGNLGPGGETGRAFASEAQPIRTVRQVWHGSQRSSLAQQ